MRRVSIDLPIMQQAGTQLCLCHALLAPSLVRSCQNIWECCTAKQCTAVVLLMSSAYTRQPASTQNM